MSKTLSILCMNKLASTHSKYLYEKLPEILYSKYVYYLMNNNYNNWKQKINLINLEVNIEDIQAEQDMYFDEPTYHIFVKKKINDIEDEDELDYDDMDYILYHEFRDDPITYNNYLEIAKMKNLLYDIEDDYDYDEDINDYDDQYTDF